VEIQESIASGRSSLKLRIGVNLGEVIVGADGDLFGDGINIAVRLEGVADPGGILISGKVHSEVDGKLDIGFEDRGDQQLKNISKPVRAFAVRAGAYGTPTERRSAAPPLPDKPSIAVLPFQNMSGDPEQEYFADGIVEEIITELSRFKWLFVIARNSSFTFKGKAVDVKQIGRELGVRYVLEGSVRKAGGRVRITGQLIDATTGAHLWADKFEGELQDVFDLQDNVATSVVGAIASKLGHAAFELVKRKPPENWASYDFYLRATSFFVQGTPDKNEQALDMFKKAVDLDPDYGPAHVYAAACIFLRPEFAGRRATDEERSEAVQLATRALDLAGNDNHVLAWAGFIFAIWNDELERGSDLVDRALAINQNWSGAWNIRGWLSLTLSDGARALDAFDRAIRLNPADDYEVLNAMLGKISAFSLLERHSDALEMVNRVLARSPNNLRAWFYRYARDPDPARAAGAADHLRALYPHLRNSDLRALYPVALIRDPKRRAFIENAIAGLGLPE
jgi:adenylate cyclase